MRISDWSSDVCSSDLGTTDKGVTAVKPENFADWHALTTEVVLQRLDADVSGLSHSEAAARLTAHGPNALPTSTVAHPVLRFLRSEERRVGKEWVSTCRSRGSPEHKKKKKKTLRNQRQSEKR